MSCRWLGLAAMGVTLGACALISGLHNYKSGDCDAGSGNACTPTTSPDAGCASGLTECGTKCVDTTSDTNYCKTCGNACSTNVTNAQPACVDSTCTFKCDSGYVSCGGACVSSSSITNCGSCGNLCAGATPVCAAGASGTYACAASCPSTASTDCGGTCADTTSDANNCKTCGNACSTSVPNAQAACAGSACGFSCKSGYTACNGACVDFTSDDGNCGGCGASFACAGGRKCKSGQCTSTCTQATDCAAGYACDTATAQCTTSCSASQPCHGGCCSSGTCAAGVATSACGVSGGQCTSCSSPNVCIGGACSPPTTSTSGYGCPTSLAPLPLCDPNHKYCLCIKDTECNSSGLSNGGCYAGDCDAGCTSLLNIDSTGCGAVLPTCNLNPSLCPANTVCEFGGNWNTRMDLCGNSYQCCWCTSDNGCPVSHKCINDLNDAGVGANNCAGTGKGPCTGKGTNWDGMHCQLTDPGGSGIPMCAAISSCAKGNCKDVTSPTATCGAAGTTCWCTNDNQCAPGKCVAWAGCGAGACNGTGMADGFNCAPY